MANKIKLLFDANSLYNGTRKNEGRSGIFYVAYNVFKELIFRDDVELTLLINSLFFDDVIDMLNQEFPIYKSRDFDVMIFGPSKYYAKLKEKREKLKEEKKNIQKLLLQLYLLPIGFFYKCKSEIRISNIMKMHCFDAYLSSQEKAPINFQCKKYTILHDLIPKLFPKYHSMYFDKGSWLYDLCQTLNKDDYYFTNSDCTRNDFLKHYPVIDPNHITTTLLACDEKFKPADMETIVKAKRKYNIPDKKYVFSLCTLEPRKNLIRAVKTFVEFIKKNNIDDMYFVLGGGHWEMFIDKLKQEISDLGEYQDKIIRAGYIDDEDLAPLYSGAEWFVYTSMYEGFGLPPLEAMSCGCPVITSNNSSLPEVVGDAGIMIDWDSDEQHIEAYEKYYFNSELRKKNRQKGLERAKQFSWKKCVNQIVEVIKSNIGEKVALQEENMNENSSKILEKEMVLK